MNIAIIGTGISGLTAAWQLHREYHLTLFEANDYLGGHTHTVTVPCQGQEYAVDTGFIVYNDWTYPHFIELLKAWEVATQPTNMSFSVRCDRANLEYSGNSLNALFAQRRNALRPYFYAMLRDVLRFNRKAKALLLQHPDSQLTLADYLAQEGFGEPFIQHYIIPMGAAIWSSAPATMGQMPARHFVRFFNNHGLLNLFERPRWRVIQGGSSRYVERLASRLQGEIRLRCPVQWIRRHDQGVEIKTAHGSQWFDQVIIATHSDQALALLADPSPQEREILAAIPYQANSVVLHTDTRLLPRRRRAWAAWNYHLFAERDAPVTVTYNMNILQNLTAPETFCVTLNCDQTIAQERILARLTYHHPVFTAAGIEAQRRRDEINGRNRTWYCGAYWGYGFHEDGVNSALSTCRALAGEQERIAA